MEPSHQPVVLDGADAAGTVLRRPAEGVGGAVAYGVPEGPVHNFVKLFRPYFKLNVCG